MGRAAVFPAVAGLDSFARREKVGATGVPSSSAPTDLAPTPSREREPDPHRPEALLQVDGVSLEYRTPERVVRATQRVSCDVHAADRFVLLGPSGCGQSALLKAVGGFVVPVEGEIRLDGHRVRGPGPVHIVVF